MMEEEAEKKVGTSVSGEQQSVIARITKHCCVLLVLFSLSSGSYWFDLD